MKWQVLVDGRLKEEVEVTDTGWKVRMPDDGVTLTYSKDGGFSMTTKTMSRVELKLVPEEVAPAHCRNGHKHYEFRNGDHVEV